MTIYVYFLVFDLSYRRKISVNRKTSMFEHMDIEENFLYYTYYRSLRKWWRSIRRARSSQWPYIYQHPQRSHFLSPMWRSTSDHLCRRLAEISNLVNKRGVIKTRKRICLLLQKSLAGRHEDKMSFIRTAHPYFLLTILTRYVIVEKHSMSTFVYIQQCYYLNNSNTKLHL